MIGRRNHSGFKLFPPSTPEDTGETPGCGAENMAEETKSGPDSGQLKDPKPSTAEEGADAVDREAGEERAGEREQNQKAQGRFVVGVGASAGGLEALEELLNEITDINAAVVVVQHLSPHYAGKCSLINVQLPIVIVGGAFGAASLIKERAKRHLR
jgi:hypothetical protein